MSGLNVPESSLLTARLVLATVFIWAAVTKWRNLNHFGKSIDAYRVVPAAMTTVVTWLVPLAELIGGALLLINVATTWAIAGICVLLLMFTTAMGLVLLRGDHPTCGCCGTPRPQ